MNFKDVKDGRETRIEPDDELYSYDVSALFMSVPLEKALRVIREKLEEDHTLGDRTSLAPDHIIQLLSLCLKCIIILPLPRGVLLPDTWSGHGVTCFANCL